MLFTMERLVKAFTVVLVLTIFAGIAMDYFRIFSTPASRTAVTHPNVMNPFKSMFNGKKSVPSAETDRKLNLNAETVAMLRSDYGATANNLQMQVQIIERMEQYLASSFPETWRTRMPEALKIVFPDKADQLMKMFVKLDSYNVWVDKNWGRLLGMKKAGRDDVLRQKRNEIFGSEAQEIWKGDLRADAIYRILDGLNRVKGSPLMEELDFFIGSIRQAYGSDADAFIVKHQQELLDSFLGLESVQAALKAMRPDKERQTLREIRKGFGMGENELAQWEEIDKVRDEQWAKGLEYLNERQRVMATIQGEARDRLVSDLRKKYFPKDAETIAAEERAGVFRFSGQRVYGKN